VEIFLKVRVYRWDFFTGIDRRWNIFDIILLALMAVEMVLTVLQAFDLPGINIFRVLRLFRLARVFRLLRVVRLLSELRIMIVCMLSSMITLFWSALMLIFTLYFGALFTMQIMAHANLPDAGGDQDLETLQKWFSTVHETMVLLYMCCTGGVDWGVVYLYMTKLGFVQTVIFLLLILFYQLSFFNILTSIFVNKALRLGAPEEEAAEREMIQRALGEIIAGFDEDRSGTISASEFSQVLKEKSMRRLLDRFGLDTKEVEILFSMLTTIGKSDGLTVDQIVTGLMKVKGVATNQDILACRLDLWLQSQAIIDNVATLERYLLLSLGDSDEEDGDWGQEASFTLV